MVLNFATLLQGWCYTTQRLKNLSQRCVAGSRTDRSRFVLLATIAVTKVLREMSVAGYITLSNFSCNLCRNKIARHVGGKIACLILVSEHHRSAPIIFTVGYSVHLLIHDTKSVLGNSAPYRQKKNRTLWLEGPINLWNKFLLPNKQTNEFIHLHLYADCVSRITTV